MSIYPVQLREWFPVGNEYHETCIIIVNTNKCYACHDKINWRKAWGHHSIPWGYGDIWCSYKCLSSRKIGKLDKRQQRKVNRRIKRIMRHFK